MNKNLEKFNVDWLFHFGLEFPRDEKLFEGVSQPYVHKHKH